MKNICIFLIFCIFFYLNVNAQSPVYKNYGVSDGLPSSEVYHVIQDSKGFIWLASNAGVSRFDGYSFKNFTRSNGLPDDTVFEIYEDHEGRVWFIPFSCKLSYFKNDSIHLFAFNDSLQKRLISPNPIKKSFYIDEEGTVYIGVYGHPIITIKKDGQTSELKDYNKYDALVNIHVIDERKALLSTSGYYFDSLIVNKNNQSFRIAAPKVAGRRITYYQNQNNLWYAEGNQIIRIKDSLQVQTKKFLRDIIWMEADINDKLWVGFYNGGIDCYLNTGVFNSTPVHYMSQLSVSSALKDNENGIWFTTLTDGVFYISNPTISNISIEEGLPSKKINCISHYKNKLWIGCNTNVLSCMESGRLTNYPLPGIKDMEIISMMTDTTDGSLWLSTDRMLYHLKDGKFVDFQEKILTKDNLSNPSENIQFNQIIHGRENTIWLGGSKGIYSVKNDQLYLHNRNISNKIRVNDLGEDSEGNIWICNNEGVWLFTLKGEKGFEGELSFLGSKHPLLTNRISAIYIDKIKNRVFFASKGAGLLILQKDSVFQIKEQHGLFSNSITAMCVNERDVWLGTNSGLNKVTFTSIAEMKYSISGITENHGLVSNEIIQVKTSGTNVYVATNKGLNIFDFTEVVPNHNPPPIYITGVHILDQDTCFRDRYALNYSQNTVSINYVGLAYHTGGNVSYKYRLDKDNTPGKWVSQNHNEIRFSFLSPGNYHFFVTAQNEDGQWSEQLATLSFTIALPYWETWWFRLLIFLIAVLLVALVFFIIYRIRINEARKRIKLKREEVRKRNTLLKDLNKYKQQVLNKQMNPHFIFNSLNSIQRYILKNDRMKSNLYLTKFATLMRIILNNSMQNLILIKDDMDALQLYLELEALRFEDRFEYAIDIEDEKILQCKIPPLFIQPFVENSIWHGLMPKEGVGKITISFVFKNDKEILCTITDDGIGRKQADASKGKELKEHKSWGTNLTSARLDTINSLYNTSMKIEFEDLENEDCNATGTSVKVTLPVIHEENADTF